MAWLPPPDRIFIWRSQVLESRETSYFLWSWTSCFCSRFLTFRLSGGDKLEIHFIFSVLVSNRDSSAFCGILWVFCVLNNLIKTLLLAGVSRLCLCLLSFLYCLLSWFLTHDKKDIPEILVESRLFEPCILSCTVSLRSQLKSTCWLWERRQDARLIDRCVYHHSNI